MTDLAWLIYGAEVLGNLGFAFGVIILVTGGATIFGAIGMTATASIDGTDSEEFARTKWFTQRFALITIVSVLMGVAVPSKNTVLLMAAANYGDELYKSELKEIVDPAKELLKKWINEQLQEKKK